MEKSSQVEKEVSSSNQHQTQGVTVATGANDLDINANAELKLFNRRGNDSNRTMTGNIDCKESTFNNNNSGISVLNCRIL